MPITQSQAALHTTNMVKKGVLKEIIREAPVLQDMQWIDVVGNAYQYTRQSTLPDVQFYSPNEVWTESTGDVTQHTAVLRIMGGDADVDNFLRQTRSNYTDIEAETIEDKATAAKHTAMDSIYYGDNSANPKQFDGLAKIVSTITAQQIHEGSGSTGSALNASNLDLIVHKVRAGKPQMLTMTREIHARMAQYLRAKNNLFTTDRDKYGNWMTMWNGMRVEYDDFLTQTETITSGAFSSKTGGATSSIWALRFGLKDFLGLQSGGLSTKKLGQLESKDAVRWRVKWYISCALMRTIAVGWIDGITDVAMAD